MRTQGFPCWWAIVLGVLLSQALAAQDLRDGFATQVEGGRVVAMAIEADGRVLIGGDFTRVNDVDCVSMCRLNVDGTVANTFPGFSTDLLVTALAVQPDGRIVYARASPTGAFAVGRLFGSGAPDFSLDVPLNARINVLAIEDDGGILVGGLSGILAGVSSSSLVRPMAACW